MKYMPLLDKLLRLRENLEMFILADDLEQKLQDGFEICGLTADDEASANVIRENFSLLEEIFIAGKADLESKLSRCGVLQSRLENYFKNTHRRIDILLKRSHAEAMLLLKLDKSLENEVMAIFAEVAIAGASGEAELLFRMERAGWDAADLVRGVLQTQNEKLLDIVNGLLDEYGHWLEPALNEIQGLGVAEIEIMNLRFRAREIRFGGLNRMPTPVFKWAGSLHPETDDLAAEFMTHIRQIVDRSLRAAEEGLAEHARLLRVACFMGADNEAAYLKPQLRQMLVAIEKNIRQRHEVMRFDIKPEIDRLWTAMTLGLAKPSPPAVDMK